MYVEPSTDIILYAGYPFDNSYEHSVWFSSESAQTAYFNSLSNKTYSANSYQRTGRNYIKLNAKISEVQVYNYLMFQNKAHENKKFYAFITKIEYLNENVTVIYYEIDVLQTWFFNFTLKKCYVEREHSSTDVRGEHLLNEPVQINGVVCHNITRSPYFDEYVAVVAHAPIGESGG